MVYQALINNLGCPGMNRITSAMSLPPITQGKFDRYTRYLYERMEPHFQACMKTANITESSQETKKNRKET